MGKSKYYYDYTRNMSDEQIKLSGCGKPNCINANCSCPNVVRVEADPFAEWTADLEEKEQPEACNINDPDCENCGS